MPFSLPTTPLPRLALSLLAGLLTTGALHSAEKPLLSNGDFESHQKAEAWPDDWEHAKAGLTWEEEKGNHFLRFTSTEPGKMLLTYRAIPLPAEVKALEISWRWRVHDLKPGKQAWFDARLMLDLKDAAGQKMPGGPPAPYTRKDIPDWTEKKITFLLPEGARTLEFMPALFQVTSGSMDLDDVAVRAIDPAPFLAAIQTAAEAEKKAHVAPETEQKEHWPAELHVEGNQVLTKAGKSILLQGVNVVGLEFLLKGDHLFPSIRTAVEEWRANIIRLPVKEDYWFGRTSGQKDGGAAYRDLVHDAITLAANRGAYVLLDLHRFRTPTLEHYRFWTSAAGVYKDHPAVLFDLFNEPHDTTWEEWKNGGFIPDKIKPEDRPSPPGENAILGTPGVVSIGMQALVKAVRETGAHNIVVAGGLDWAYDLSGIAHGYELQDLGGNGLIYSTHIYPWKRGWQEKVLVAAEKHPILVGEVGADVNKMSFIPAEAQEDPATWVPDMLGFLQKYHLHWTGFSFHPKATPVMIQDWNYTPTPFWGAFAKRALSGEQFPLTKMR